MASSSLTKQRYLLPGERDISSSVVHNHGICKKIPITTANQSPENSFIFTSRTYKPKENDLVIGIIIVRAPDLFLVDINSTEPAVLPTTLFDHGRLPSRDAMNRFSVVYARVVCTDPWAQIILSCQSYAHSRKNSDFGLIEQGHILRCSLALCQKLQQSQLIGHFNRIVSNFNTCIALNGFVWYITDATNTMIAVKNIIYQHEFENDTEHLIDLYRILIFKLEEQDTYLIKMKPQGTKMNVKTKQIEN